MALAFSREEACLRVRDKEVDLSLRIGLIDSVEDTASYSKYPG